jgi:hypothetical protein
MAKDPKQRPSSAIEVGQWFQKIQQENGLAVTPLRSAPNAEPAAPAGAAAYTGHPVTPPPGSITPHPASSTPPPAFGPSSGPSAQGPQSFPPSTYTPTSAYGPTSGPRTSGPPTPGPATPAPATIPPPPTGPSSGPGAGSDPHQSTPYPQFIAPTYDANRAAAPTGSHSGRSGQFDRSQPAKAQAPNKNVLIGVAVGVVALIAIGVGIALAGGGGGKSDTTTTPSTEAVPTEYSAQVKEDWIDLCTGANESVSACQCSYEEFEQDIPFDEYLRVIDLFGEVFDDYPGDFATIFDTCGIS